ncbi:MAG: cupin domain-containing protein [Vicinamibacterales bacterium]
MLLACIVVYAAILTAYVGAARQSTAPPARTFQSPAGTTMRVLVDEQVLKGTEVEMAELTFPPNSDSNDHRHGVTETMYVLEGELEQVVNGTSIVLAPGKAASIRATDTVRHKTGAAGARVLVVWAPGGEIARVTSRWKITQ